MTPEDMTQRSVLAVSTHAPTLRVQIVNLDASVWVILQGEADIATLQDLKAALANVELNDPRPLYLDVTDLTFADVATIHQLAMFAQQARQSGNSVRTCGARPTLRKAASILGFHTDLGIL